MLNLLSKLNLMLAIVFLSIGKGQSQTVKQKNYPNTKEGVRQIANALDGANATVLKSFEASLDDCKALMKGEGDAQKLYAYSQKLFRNILAGAVKSKAGQTEILVFALTTGSNESSEKDRFAGGYVNNLGKFNDGITMYTFKYVEPGNTSGMRFDGLTYVNNKWVFIPKMWRAFR